MKWCSVKTIALILLSLAHCGSPSHQTGLQATPPKIEAAKSPSPEEEAASICQILKDPGAYNHKVVQVTGFFSHGFEDSVLFDPMCDSRFGIWFEYGGKNVTGTMYCCGVSSSRQRLEQISVEGISIPLVDDHEFKRFDGLLHSTGDSLVHASVVGRFFAGEKDKLPGGEERWIGYGHMGMSSLFVIQQVIKTDPRERTDLDYRASPDQPSLESKNCTSYRYLTDLDPFNKQLEMQKQADSGERSWAFDDPTRVAIDVLASVTKRPLERLKNVRLQRQAQGRMVFEWQPKGETKRFMVVLSRPYVLSFYAQDKRVAWVPAAAFESECR